METGAQPLHHGHAQRILSLQDLTDAARCSQHWHHVGTAETVLIHEVPDKIRRARRSARPFAFLIGRRDQPCLRLEPGHVGGSSDVHSRSTRARARASSASLSIKTRVASITPPPHPFCRTRRGCRRTGLPRHLPDIGRLQRVDRRSLDVEDDPTGLENARLGYYVLTSSGFCQWARLTMSIHAAYCDRAALIPLWPA
jgi:hypothetical protein